MIGQRRRLRLLVQLACFAAAILLLWPMPLWRGSPKFIAQTSPFVAICSVVALRAVGVGTGIGLAFAAIALSRRRWFCRYACPTGFLLEGASHIGFQKTSGWKRCPPLGQYVALLTVLGATVGYPMLLWMDPLSIFSSSFSIRTAGSVTSGIFAGLLLGILILLSLMSGAIWCARLCPLGGTQDLLTSAQSLFQGGQKNRLEPTASAPSLQAGIPLARRALLLGAAGMGMGLWARQIGAARGENAPLRPPGAVAEKQFTGLCIRCGNCVRTCPSGIIHPDSGQAGIWGLLAPMIRYEKKYCLEDCAACMQVCPSGALQTLDLKQKSKYMIGEALMDGSICLLVLGKKDCDACMRACPYDAVRIHWDEMRYIAYPIVDVNKCNGCGACEAACPIDGIKAIRIWKASN